MIEAFAPLESQRVQAVPARRCLLSLSFDPSLELVAGSRRGGISEHGIKFGGRKPNIPLTAAVECTNSVPNRDGLPEFVALNPGGIQ